MTQLRKELDQFWNWASITPAEYSKKYDGGEWETGYPHWDLLYRCVEDEIEKAEEENRVCSIVDILEAMAIDNECENVLTMIEENSIVSHLIIEKYRDYYQPEARWQIAELIKRVSPLCAENNLIEMILNDKNKYVQRRALLSLNELSHDKAKQYALLKINDNDKFLKRTSKRILFDE